MTKEEAKRFAEVLLAYSQGKPIQHRGTAGPWMNYVAPELAFDMPPCQYRLPPEKRLCRVWLHRSTSGICPWLLKEMSAEFNWDSFAKNTQGFAGWLTEPLEYES